MFWINENLSGLGIKSASSQVMNAALDRWNTMYKSGSALNLASAVASETARLVTLEMKCSLSGSERAYFLNEQLTGAKPFLRNSVECACALGGVVLKPYVSNGGIEIDFVRPENFVPTEFDTSGNLTGAVFLDRRYIGGKVFTRVEQHTHEGGGYTVKNDAFVSDSDIVLGRRIPLSAVESWADIEPSVHMESIASPLFAYFKMPMANTLDEASPLGISVFAKAEKLIADANEQYERLLWEFESGKRVVMADETAFRLSENGERELPDDRLYVALNQEELFKEWSPTLREDGFIHGLNEILRRIEFNCSLAYGTLSDVQYSDKTAEEVRSSKQRSYSHIADIQSALKGSLTSLCTAMDTLCDLYRLAPKGSWELAAEFDDSIVADRKREFDEKLSLVQAGIMDREEFRGWYFG